MSHANNWFTRSTGNRSQRRAAEAKARKAAQPQVTQLEDRCNPVNVTFSGTTALLDLNVANEVVTLHAINATAVEIASNHSVTVDGSPVGNPYGLGGMSGFVITDSAAGTSLTFADSAFTYAAGFSVTLDNSPGQVTFNGTSAFGGANSLSVTTARNIVVNSGASVSTDSGSLTLSANQQPTATSGNFRGVEVIGSVSSSTGSVSVSGRGGDTGSHNSGVFVNNGTIRTTAPGGTVDVRGTGGASSIGSNYGVYMVGSGAVITSDVGSGAVTVAGFGGGSGSGGGNFGVYVSSGQITAGGSGTVDVTGTGGSTSGNSNYGVYLASSTAIITSGAGGGAVTVAGVGGGSGVSSNNNGVSLVGGQITAGGSGTVDVTGTGGTGSTAYNHGVYVATSGSAIKTGVGGGAVTVAGTGGTGGGYGVFLQTGEISSGEAVSVTGTGASNYHGIYLYQTSTVTSGGTADLTLTADSLAVDGTSTVRAGSTGTGTATLRPNTAGTRVMLGNSDQFGSNPALGLTDGELDRVFAGTLVLGRNTAGALLVLDTVTRPASTNVQLVSGADITTFASGTFNTAGGTLSVTPGTDTGEGFDPSASGTDVTASTLSFAGGSDLKLSINGNTADSGYTRLAVAGTVNLANVELALSGAYNPNAGDVFTIVSATSVSGEFTGLPDGTVFTFNGQKLRINYTGTTVTLTSDATLSVILNSLLELRITDLTGQDNTLTAKVSGSNLEITETGAGIFGGPPAGSTLSADRKTLTVPLSSISQVFFLTQGGSDTLSLDYSGGRFGKTMTFAGGSGTSDKLALVRGTSTGVFQQINHTFANASDGSVLLSDTTFSIDAVYYSGLEPISDNLDTVDRVFSFSGADDAIELKPSTASGFDLNIDSNAAESTDFAAPSGSLSIRAGDGNDTITLPTALTGQGYSISLSGDTGTDTIAVNAPVSTTGEFSATADNITLGAGIDTTLAANDQAIQLTGATTLTTSVALSSGTANTTLNGSVDLGSNTLTVTSGNTALDAVSGSGGVVRNGTAASILHLGSNAYTGPTQVNAGLVRLNGSNASPITTAAGTTLQGIGSTTGLVTVGGTLSPNANDAVGTLAAGGLNLLASGTYFVDLQGTASNQRDVVNVTGGVTLAGALVVNPASFAVPPGQRFTIIDNDGSDLIGTTFAGLPEGATVLYNFNGTGQDLRVTYKGGDGNDVQLFLNQLPATASASGPYTVAEGGTLTLSATATDPDNDALTFAWDINGDGLFTDAGGANPTLTWAQLQALGIGDGSAAGTLFNNVRVRVTDGYSLASVTSAATTLTVTNTSPTIGQFNVPTTGVEGTAVLVSGTATDPAGLADPLTYTWSVTGPNGYSASGSGQSFGFTPNDNGSFVVTLTVSDGDGGSTTDSRTVVVANANPTPSIAGPTSGSEGGSYTYTASATDPGTADTTFTYAWSVTKNGVTYASGTGTTFTLTPDDNGTYVVTLAATDKDGGVGVATKTVEVSNVIPQGVNIGADRTVAEGSGATFTAAFTDPGTADTHTVAWVVTNNAGGAVVATGSGTTFTFTPADQGTYTVTATVTDDDGGSATDSATVNVSNAAPTAGVTGPTTANEGQAVSFAGTFTDPAGAADGPFTYAWSVVASNGQSVPPQSGAVPAYGNVPAFTFTPTDNGTYTVSLVVTDKDGTASAAATTTLTVNNVAPAVTSFVVPGTGSEGTPVTVSATAIDPAGANDPLTYTWSVLKNGSAFASGTGASYTFTPDDDGTYAVTLVVTDADTGSATRTGTVVVGNVAPTAGISGPTSGVEGTALSYTSSVTDPGADTFTYAWSVTKNGAAFGAAGAASAYSFTPDDDAAYELTLTVTDDDGGSVTATKTVVVGNLNPTIATFTVPPTGTEGTAVALVAAATDPAGANDPLTYTWVVTGPNGYSTTLTGATASFTPPDDGTYAVTLTVTDGDGGTASTSGTVVVANAAPSTPTLTLSPTVVNEGGAVTLGGTFTDAGVLDAHTVTINWGDGTADTVFTLPAGVTTFAGLPHAYADDDADDQFTITVTVDDGDTGVATAAVVATVDNVAPTVSVTGPTAGIEGTALSYSGTFTDPAGANDTYTLAWAVSKNGVPGFASGTGASFTFTPDDDGTYAVTFTVADGDGGSTPVTLTVAVANVAPTATITGVPNAPVEGTAITLGSTVGDPAGANDPPTYLWTVTKSGAAYPVGGNTSAAFTFTPDDDGLYVVKLTVGDGDGGSTTASETIVVGNVAPSALSLTLTPTAVSEGGTVSLDGTFSSPAASGDAHTVTVNWGDGATETVSLASGTFAFSGLTHTYADDDADDAYTVTVTVADGDGGSVTQTTTAAVTNVAPTVALTGVPAGSVPEGTAVTLGSTVTDPGSPEAFTHTWTVLKNGSPFATGSGASFTFTPDDDGTYTVTLVVTDGDGGSTPASAAITVTDSAPTVSVSGPTAGHEGDSLTFAGSFTDPAGTADGQYSFTYTATNGTLTYTQTGTVASPGAVPAFTFTPLDNGTFTVTLAVTDADGVAATPATASVTVANVAPTITGVSVPATGTEGTAVTLSATATDPAGANDPLTSTWVVTGPNGFSTTLTGATASFTPPDDGTYTVSLTVTDGDTGAATRSGTVVVGNAPPTASVSGPATSPEGGSVTASGTFTDAAGAADGPFTYAWSVVAGNGQSVSGLSGTAPAYGTVPDFTFTPTDNGSYTVSLVVTDKDGTSSSPATFAVTVGNANPTIGTFTVPGTGTEGSPVALSSAATDPAGANDPLTSTWVVTGPNGFSTTLTGATASFTPPDDGTYTVTLTVTDGDGGSATNTATVVVDNANPVIDQFNVPTTAVEGSGVGVSATATDPAGLADPLTYTWTVLKNGSPFAAGTGPSYSFTPDDNGTYDVTLTVTDGDGGTATRTQAVTVSNAAPQAAIVGPTGGVEGAPLSYSASVVDPAGANDPLNYLWTVTKNGVAFGTAGTAATYTFTPDDNATYLLTLAVTDGDGGQSLDSRLLVVTNANPTIDVFDVPSAGTEGTPVTVSATATDPGGANDPLTYSWAVTKNGSPFASGGGTSLTFTPDDDGSYAVTLTVTDDDGGIATRTATVAVANLAPTITAFSVPAGGVAESPVTMSAAANDPAGANDPLTYSWVVVSDDGTTTAGGGTSFTFTPPSAGGYTVTLTVTDGDGGTATAQAVVVAAPKPILPPPPVVVYSVGGTVTVRDVATGGVRQFVPFPGFLGSVTTASGDLNGDGVLDVVVGAGAGGGPHVKAYDGASGMELASFFAFDLAFTGGISVAATNGRIVVGAGPGGGPHVKVIDFARIGERRADGVIAESALVGNFFAFDLGFKGGVSVAAADVTGDGVPDVVVGAGPGGTAHVKGIDGNRLGDVRADGVIADSATFANFFAFDPGFAGGVNVAATGGRIAVAAGAGAGPHVKVIDSPNLGRVRADGVIADHAPTASFFAFDPSFTGGVRVRFADADGDGDLDLLTGAGPGGTPHLKAFNIVPLVALESVLVGNANDSRGVVV